MTQVEEWDYFIEFEGKVESGLVKRLQGEGYEVRSYRERERVRVAESGY